MSTDSSLSQPDWVLVGPTAVGKSGVALLLAEHLPGEIVSVDSMQVYRGLDVGTDKPSVSMRARVPHHLIDVVDPDQPFDASQYAARAAEITREIRGRGRLTLACGGTGFYLKAWVEGLGSLPPSDPALRRALEATPLPELLEELARLDPETHGRIDRQNPRRVVRAVESLRLTGQPLGEQRAAWRPAEALPGPRPRWFGLSRPPDSLDRRIDARVDQMFARGLVEETRSLLEAGLRSNPTACQAIGYRQVLEHLEGQRSLQETVDLVKRRTRQLARRQWTWFRRQTPLTWLEIGDAEEDASVVERMLNLAAGGAKGEPDWDRG